MFNRVIANASCKTKIGGFALKYIKETKRRQIRFPSASTVLANAMGLGPTEPVSILAILLL
jgi:hypothetical protein